MTPLPRLSLDEDLDLLLAASRIPDGSSVFKRTGDVAYTLKQNMKVYPIPKSGEQILEVKGCFLVGANGSINQIEPTTVLRWRINAEDLMLMIQDEVNERDSK